MVGGDMLYTVTLWHSLVSGSVIATLCLLLFFCWFFLKDILFSFTESAVDFIYFQIMLWRSNVFRDEGDHGAGIDLLSFIYHGDNHGYYPGRTLPSKTRRARRWRRRRTRTRATWRTRRRQMSRWRRSRCGHRCVELYLSWWQSWLLPGRILQ